jgi:peptide/nickel transport system substrate-binding protein
LLNGENILPTNNSNYSQVKIPENDATMDKLRQQQLTDEVKKQYAALDKSYMQQAVMAPYGNEQYATFVSDRIDFDQAYSHLLFGQDFSDLRLK